MIDDRPRNDDPGPVPREPVDPAELTGAIGAKYKALGGKKWGEPVNYPTTGNDGSQHVSFKPPGGRTVTKAIYWTPRTGAFVMSGAIWEAWRTYRGPASLGYPTSDPLPTHDGAGLYQTFEHCTYVWHPATGAHEVHGDIAARYGALGGSRFGYPTTDETVCPDRRGRFNHFRDPATGSDKSIYWTPETNAHEVFGLILQDWAALGFERSPLGYPTSGEMPTHDGIGRWQTFESGIYVWHPDTGAHEVHGAILDRYYQLGGSRWGYPTTNEGEAKDGGRFNHFRVVPGGEQRSIYWHPQTGEVEVYGDIHARYEQLGWEHSSLGYPVSPEEAWPEGGAGSRQQRFQGGRLLWRAADRATAPDPVAFHRDLHGGGGFGGHAKMHLFADGTVRFFGEVTNGAYQDYDYDIYALARTPNLALAMRKSGEINMQAIGRNVNRWEEKVHNDAVRDNYFAEFQHATYEVHDSHEGAITGVLDDILTTVLSWAVTGALGPGIVGLIYAGIELGAVATGGSWSAGPRIVAGSMWMLGPEGFLVSMAVDALARIGSQSRGPTAEEKTLLRAVFANQLDVDRITLTDTKGKSGRAFTFPSPMPDTKMNLNLGDDYMKTPDLSKRSYYELLVHEATHAWQYAHMANHSSYVLHGIFDSEYDPGALDKAWGKYNIEQQATVVEEWVGRHYTPGAPANDYGLSSPNALNDPAFKYVAGNIRVGKS